MAWLIALLCIVFTTSGLLFWLHQRWQRANDVKSMVKTFRHLFGWFWLSQLLFFSYLIIFSTRNLEFAAYFILCLSAFIFILLIHFVRLWISLKNGKAERDDKEIMALWENFFESNERYTFRKIFSEVFKDVISHTFLSRRAPALVAILFSIGVIIESVVFAIPLKLCEPSLKASEHVNPTLVAFLSVLLFSYGWFRDGDNKLTKFLARALPDYEKTSSGRRIGHWPFSRMS